MTDISNPPSRRPSGGALDMLLGPDGRPVQQGTSVGSQHRALTLSKQKSLGPDLRRVVPRPVSKAKMTRSRTFSHGVSSLPASTHLDLKDNSLAGSDFKLFPGGLAAAALLQGRQLACGCAAAAAPPHVPASLLCCGVTQPLPCMQMTT